MARRALCIGINQYPDTGADLAGCVNDAHDWAAALGRRGYETRILVDQQATLQGLRTALDAWLAGAGAADQRVLTFSGHGTVQPDGPNALDEADGLDDGLAPHDIATSGALLDDELHARLEASPADILVLADCCHSGTVVRAGMVSGPMRPRFLPMARWMPRAQLAQLESQSLGHARPPLLRGKTQRPQPKALLMSACEEGADRFAWDATILGRACGAFSFYALQTLGELAVGASHAEWHQAIVQALPFDRYPQRPQLYGGMALRQRPALA